MYVSINIRHLWEFVHDNGISLGVLCGMLLASVCLVGSILSIVKFYEAISIQKGSTTISLFRNRLIMLPTMS